MKAQARDHVTQVNAGSIVLHDDGTQVDTILSICLREIAIMIDNPRTRRFLSAVLILLGAVLIFLAPDNAWIGVVLAVLGLAIEGIAVTLGHRGKAKDRDL